jgi:hypothetical protein
VKLITRRLGDVQFNPWNPNDMTPRKRKALRASLEAEGYVQPARVRELDGGLVQVIDGEQRLRVMLEIHGPDYEIELVSTDADDTQAKLNTLTMNRIRGEHVPIKEALVMVDLLGSMSMGELEERLGMPHEDVEQILGELDDPEDAPPEKDAEGGREISIFLYPGQHAVFAEALERAIQLMPHDDSIPIAGEDAISTVEDALAKAKRLTESESRGHALEMICAAFLATPDESFG